MGYFRAAALLPLLFLAARADTITLTFSGTWGGSLAPVSQGDAFSGTAVWDPSTVGEYLPNSAPLSSFGLTIGNPADDLSSTFSSSGVTGANLLFLGANWNGAGFDFVQANEQPASGGDYYAFYLPVTPSSYAQMTDVTSQSSIYSSAYSASISESVAGGSVSAPASLVSAGPIGAVTGTIAGDGADEYYSFAWDGGAFSATASIFGANANGSYLFSEGGIGACAAGANATLDSDDSFSGTISIDNLAPGQYCIGLEADNTNNPAYTLTFNTPVESSPEPPGAVLALIGAMLMTAGGFYRRQAK